MNIARSSLKIFGVYTANAVLAFVGLAFFAHRLDPAQLGVYFLFEAVLGVLAVVTGFGLETAIEKRISEGEEAEDYLATGVLLKAGFTVVAAAGIVLFGGPINAYIGADVAVLLAVSVALRDAGELAIGVLRGELRVGDTAVVTFARQAVWVGVGAALVIAGLGVRGLIYGLLLGQTVRVVWAAYRCSTRLGRPSREHARSLLDFGKYDLIAGLGWHTFSWVDVLVIGWLLTSAAVGVYEVAWRVAAITMLLSRGVGSVMIPQVSAWDASAATDRIERLLTNVTTPSLLMVVPSFFGVLLLSEPILQLLFGTEYGVASLALVVLVAGKVFDAIQRLFGQCLVGINRPDLVARATVVVIGLNLVSNVLLIGEFGILGAAVTTTVSYLIGMALRMRYLSRFLTIALPYREIQWCVLASGVMAAVVYGLRAVLTVDTLPELFGVVGVGAVVYGAVVLVSKPLRRRAVSTTNQLLGRVGS
jgi:O-antigen/teichoic acid export membrane protein